MPTALELPRIEDKAKKKRLLDADITQLPPLFNPTPEKKGKNINWLKLQIVTFNKIQSRKKVTKNKFRPNSSKNGKILRSETKRVRNIFKGVKKLFKRLTVTMATKRPPFRKPRELGEKVIDLPEVALAAIASYKKQKEVADFVNFLLGALERNSNWLNTIVGRQCNFRCALMVGAGPNRFQLQETIYPSGGSDIKLEVELKDSEDHDKIAIAALVKLNNLDFEHLMKYIKTRLCDNPQLREDLVKGKALGVSFAVLRPFSDKQYRVMERIIIGSSMKCVVPPIKKRRRDEKLLNGPPFKKTRKVI